MNDTIPLRTRPMTPEEVLNRFCAWGDPREAAAITPDLSVKDLATDFTDDLQFWTGRSAVRELGRLIDETFSISIDEWETEWLPPIRRTVGELCERIAGAAEVIVPEPVTVLGRLCLSAGTFLAVRTLLARAGADVTGIKPSTPLTPLVRQWPAVFRGPVGRMAEARVWVDVSSRASRADGCLLGLATLAVFGGISFGTAFMVIAAIAAKDGPSWWMLPSVVLCVGGNLACFAGLARCFCSSHRLMQQLEIPGLRDFRDLVDTILNRPLRRQNLRTAP